MSAGYDPFKWADMYESEEEYMKEMEECLQQKNDGKILKDTKDYTKYQAQAE